MAGLNRKLHGLLVRLPKGFEPFFALVLLAVDAFLLNLIFLKVFNFWLVEIPDEYLYVTSYLRVRCLLLGIYIFWGSLAGIFNIKAKKGASDLFFQLLTALGASFLSFNLIAFLSRHIAEMSHNFPRAVFLIALFIGLFTLFFVRIFLFTFFLPHKKLLKAVTIGDVQTAGQMVRWFHRHMPVRVIILKHYDASDIENLASFVVFHHVDEIIVADHELNLDSFWSQIFYARKEEPHHFRVRFAVNKAVSGGLTAMKTLDGYPMVTLSSRPITGIRAFGKRLFDIVFSAAAIVISAPAMIFTALAVKLRLNGSIFYKQKRIGRFGKEYDLIKFRTMKLGSENESGPQVSGEDDPRITPFFKKLRNYGFDELPQFFLVLAGEMSVVGPRPERAFFADQMPEFQGRRLSVKPGVTGLAVVNSRFYTEMTDKVLYDLYYIDNYSLMLDIKIIFQTVWILLFGYGTKA
ncbi:MAG: exopolysaccharide biosynthesis polyprenyl glycosylphosphotransferase [Candidatus Riflebacteria bacterium]|nr:exopolysaccharide biosynthesis polyprenyl glycosylphosphotransferase [Candidatus Riflebacteria bacterium]